ncbi:MAG: 4-phosphoerythronate dehydrogenase [Phycisphaerales bacterium]|nr:MAG: 4-phosphoerythronate dehydrogenase [Phycisphaerales bacterium]
MRIVADANIPFVEECFSSIGDVRAVSGREMTPEVVADADVLLVRSVTPVGPELLDGSRVRFVATATIGLDHVDTEYLGRMSIGFASAPGSNANSAAEYVIAALLEVAQKYDVDLAAKSIGIIGAGNVGGRVALKAEALGMGVYLNDPPLERQTGDSKYRPLEELFDCDFITLHTPLTFEGPDKTYHLADEAFFESLKERCVFLNASRGGVVDSGALKAAIRSGRLRAVVLDVWENEPNIDGALLEMVDIGTPHIAGYSLDGKVAGMMMVYGAVCGHCGIEPRFTAADFLPEAIIPELRVDPHGVEQDVLLGAVQRIYDIRRDDVRLRWMLEKAPYKRGRFFDNLRKSYPVRRELHNTRVVLTAGNEVVAGKLRGIGFGEVTSR